MRLPLQSRIVTAPDGARWRVSVRWMPWTPRQRMRIRSGEDSWSALDVATFAADDVAGCAVGLLVAVVVLLLVVALPIVLLVLEVAVLVALAIPAAVLLALVGITRWQVEVESERLHEPRRWLVEYHRGTRAADAAIADIAGRIERGLLRLDGPG